MLAAAAHRPDAGRARRLGRPRDMTRVTSERRFVGMRLPRILRGFASCPILRRDGTLACTEGGYDGETETLVVAPPRIIIPERPTLDDALAIRQLLRKFFDTFQHQGEGDPKPDALGILHNDISKPPGHGEIAALALLLTMVARSTLPIVPGFLLRAASG